MTTAAMSIEIGDSVMGDLDYMETFDALAATHGFTEGDDYRWYVAMGDDMPNGLDIYNKKMLEVKEIAELAVLHEGKSCYS